MGTPKIKEELFQLIEESDDRLLSLLHAVAKEYVREDHALAGEPLSHEQLKKRIIAAKKSIQSGHFTSQEDLEKEIEKW
ncbi:hypothetical protein [Belliella pelovolcani]|uniref:hypothetical protein n=1 Tax=Belliella pelovolcani TaxID=529505 RepID=UPI00391D637B